MTHLFTRPSITSTPASRVGPLLDLALSGLVKMFCKEANLFCYKLKQTPLGLMREGRSSRYTLMTLMGLSRAESAGLRVPVEIRPILDGLTRNLKWVETLGDFGLLLWACSIIAPEGLQRITSEVDPNWALNHYPDGRGRRTMELAWFLAGLAHMRLVNNSGSPDYSNLALKTYKLLEANQGVGGIFRHVGRQWSPGAMLRGWLGSFADQVYPIYALSKFARAFEVDTAIRRAETCANAICEAQGPLGQWWWHYDSNTGRVVGQYAVYSVHQEGMAPMALFSLGDVNKHDFTQPIFSGLEWITGSNEIGCDLRDFSNCTVWRSVYQPRYRAYTNEVLATLSLPQSCSGLKVRYECRPYELGWLLYAFAPLYSDFHFRTTRSFEAGAARA